MIVFPDLRRIVLIAAGSTTARTLSLCFLRYTQFHTLIPKITFFCQSQTTRVRNSLRRPGYEKTISTDCTISCSGLKSDGQFSHSTSWRSQSRASCRPMSPTTLVALRTSGEAKIHRERFTNTFCANNMITARIPLDVYCLHLMRHFCLCHSVSHNFATRFILFAVTSKLRHQKPHD